MAQERLSTAVKWADDRLGGAKIGKKNPAGARSPDRERLLHGRESGVIVRSPDGGYSEKREQISTYEAYALTARDRDTAHSGHSSDTAELEPRSDRAAPTTRPQ